MGVPHLTVYDEDGVSAINLSNQMFRKQDLREFKVNALESILNDFSDAKIIAKNQFYKKQKLEETVIVGTDSIESRQLVWEAFKKQKQCIHYIEARMGAQLGIVYTISKKSGKLNKEDKLFYESILYDGRKPEPLPCTAKSIIYNILMISSLICRSYKAVITKESYPREVIFNMTEIGERTFMFRK
jgi:hypothetical protein